MYNAPDFLWLVLALVIAIPGAIVNTAQILWWLWKCARKLVGWLRQPTKKLVGMAKALLRAVKSKWSL